MTRDQKVVAVGAASGIVSMLLAMWLLSRLLPVPAEAAAVGNARFASEAIDPTLGKEDRKTIVNGRVADNTLQQLALFAAGTLGLAAVLPPEQLPVIGAAAIVFAVCRILFWIGYRIHPLYRAFGFSSTAYLNLGLLLAAGWFALA